MYRFSGVSVLTVIPTTYRHQWVFRAGSDKFLMCQIRGKNPRVRLSALEEKPHLSMFTGPRYNPYLTGHDPTRPLRLLNSNLIRPDPLEVKHPTRSDPTSDIVSYQTRTDPWDFQNVLPDTTWPMRFWAPLDLIRTEPTRDILNASEPTRGSGYDPWTARFNILPTRFERILIERYCQNLSKWYIINPSVVKTDLYRKEISK